jgi:hypothetical protein
MLQNRLNMAGAAPKSTSTIAQALTTAPARPGTAESLSVEHEAVVTDLDVTAVALQQQASDKGPGTSARRRPKQRPATALGLGTMHADTQKSEGHKPARKGIFLFDP